MSKITRIPFLYTSEEALQWITDFTRLWNAEFRQSFDQETGETVVEIVYSNSTCKSARSRIPAQAMQILIDSLGGISDPSL